MSRLTCEVERKCRLSWGVNGCVFFFCWMRMTWCLSARFLRRLSFTELHTMQWF